MQRIIKDLKRVIMMYWHEERKHWEGLDNPEDHIFISLNNITNYLEGLKRKEEENEKQEKD